MRELRQRKMDAPGKRARGAQVTVMRRERDLRQRFRVRRDSPQVHRPPPGRKAGRGRRVRVARAPCPTIHVPVWVQRTLQPI